MTAALDNKTVCMSVQMPCLISMENDINTPRLPSYKVKQSIGEEAVSFLSFADFGDQDERHYGLAGSATQVERIFPPEKNTERCAVEGSANEQAEALCGLVRKLKLV